MSNDIIPADDSGLPIDAPIPPNPMVVMHRLTMVQTFYHQVNGGDANEIRTSASRILQTDEEVYERTTSVDEVAVHMDFGWCTDLPIGLLVIKNLEVTKPGQPIKMLELVFPGSEISILIPPQEMVAFYPKNPKLLALRANNGKTKYTLFVVPG